MVKENLKKIQRKIKKICSKKRNPQEITLIGISKKQPIEKIKEAYEAGLRHFGENTAQEFLEKYNKLPHDIVWHFVGHLQKNKVKLIIDKISFLHSLDSFELAEEIEKKAAHINRKINCFIEVNVGKEKTKFGIDEREIENLLSQLKQLPHLNIIGLMCLPPFEVEVERIRPYFSKLKKLSQTHSLHCTSMGMSHDFEVAIEEGATHLRIGETLFGERK